MKSPQITWINAGDPPESFPDVERAFQVPDGLLAAGGDLSEDRLLYAYAHGIFPWYSDGQPILWWSPDPRCVIYPDRLHVSRRLERGLRRSGFEISFDTEFERVIDRCAQDRPGQDGTWITGEMREAYCRLHRQGWAHSVEVWKDGQLAGGLYGLAIDRIFFGESMFSDQSDGSKAALVALCSLMIDRGYRLLDCQVESPHLRSLGADAVPRRQFSNELRRFSATQEKDPNWPSERTEIARFSR
jgi:leucyl/phenylalanyl-tRNA--protein transferase